MNSPFTDQFVKMTSLYVVKAPLDWCSNLAWDHRVWRLVGVDMVDCRHTIDGRILLIAVDPGKVVSRRPP